MGKIAVIGTSTGNVVEDAANNVVGGDLNVRGGPDLFVAVDYIQGKYGHFTIALDGVWTYTLDNSDPDTQALGGGKAVKDHFWAVTADGSAQRAVVVSINGVVDDVVAATEIGLVGVPDSGA